MNRLAAPIAACYNPGNPPSVEGYGSAHTPRHRLRAGALGPRLGLILALAILAGCTAEQQQAAAKYHANIQYVCRQAMAVAPMFPDVAPWLVGACSTEQTIARLALDSSSLAWLSGILSKL